MAAFESIATYTFPSDTNSATIYFNGISSTFTHLMIIHTSISSHPSSGDGWGWVYNKSGGSGNTNSTTRRLLWGTSMGGDNVDNTGVLAAPSYFSRTATNMGIFHSIHSNSSGSHTVLCRTAHIQLDNAIDGGLLNGDSSDTGATNSAALYSYYGNGIKAGTTLALFGLKDA